MDLIIVGAGGLGREVYSWLSQEIRGKSDIRIKGFIDNTESLGESLSYPVGVVGSIADYQPVDNEKLVFAIMDPEVKKKAVESLLAKGAEFYTLIHPSVIIGTNISIGKGCVICPNCIITNDIDIGDFVFINTATNVGHDVVIGDYTSINAHVDITGCSKVGTGCVFGVGAKVIPKRRIGDGALVGAGSVVIRNVPAGVTVFGNPARSIS